MPRISILTPYRNAEKYILETAESIFAQTNSNWEWVLINDHSSENEEEVLKPFLKDTRLKLLRNKGTGIIDALVTGLDHSSGKYVTRMDADDIMPQHKLDLFLQELNSSGTEVVTGKVRYFSENGIISQGYVAYENWLNERIDQGDFYDQIYRECTLSSANWMMTRDNLLNCGGFLSLNYPEDYDLLFRWYKQGYKLKGIDEVTHLWREHPERTSKNSENYSQDRFFNLKLNRFL
jgi:glycosyltransferase involved in cell wall biosynthesis